MKAHAWGAPGMSHADLFLSIDEILLPSSLLNIFPGSPITLCSLLLTRWRPYRVHLQLLVQHGRFRLDPSHPNNVQTMDQGHPRL